jgi:hypothetical protein
MCRAFFQEPIYGYLRVTEDRYTTACRQCKDIAEPRSQARSINPAVLPAVKFVQPLLYANANRTSYCMATPIKALPLLFGMSAHSFRCFVLLLPAFFKATYYFLEGDLCMQAYLVVKAKHYPSWSRLHLMHRV